MPWQPVALRVGFAAIVLILGIALVQSGLAVQPNNRPQHEQPAPRREAAPFPRPVVETQDLMTLFNRQLYQNLSAALREQPTDRDQWALIEDNALRLAEVANLVALRDYAPDHQREWIKHAARLQTTSAALARIAGKQDFEASRREYGTVIQACNACHQTFAPEAAPQLKP